MRNMPIILAFFVLLLSLPLKATATGEPLPIKELLSKGMLFAEIRGTSPYGEEKLFVDNAFYGRCLRVRLQNKTNRPLSVLLPAGTMLEPANKGVQDMYITHTESVELKPGEKKQFYIYAMCGEFSDDAPSEQDVFTVGPMGNNEVLRIIGYIEKYGMQNYGGQMALWATANRITVDNLKIQNRNKNINLRLALTLLDSAGLKLPFNQGVQMAGGTRTITIRDTVYVKEELAIVPLDSAVVTALAEVSEESAETGSPWAMQAGVATVGLLLVAGAFMVGRVTAARKPSAPEQADEEEQELA